MRGTVLVTGGSTRLGASIADALHERGWRVLVSSHRALDGALQADFREEGAAERLFEAALARAPDLSAIVNNAALFSLKGELAALDSAALEAVNARAPERLTALLSEHLKEMEDRSGCVVNILDSRILTRDPRTPYERSKQRLLEVTLRQARECAPALRVNAVAPGCVLAPVNGEHEKAASTLLASRPTPRDVAEAVAYFLESPSVTGAILPVDAGAHLMNVRGKSLR